MNDKRKILVMDDEVMIRETAREMLEVTGCEVDVACDGEEAIQKYKQAWLIGSPFHAVILDVIVPGGLGGRETMIELLNINERVKAVISSGDSGDEIMSIFHQLHHEKGITVIMITHDPEIAEHADRTVWIRDGLIVNGEH